MEKQIFITGGTGFLGSNLIVDVLRQDPTAKVIALVRSDSDVKAKERLFNALPITISDINYAEILERISVVSGDVTKVHFGLSEEDFHSLAQQITHIIHSAADVRFTLSLEEARLVNVTGTKHVFELAELAKRSGQFERVAYIGTAYVSGDRSGRITENELDCNQKFSNSYEQSKFEAEKFVRSMRDRIPVTIFRPSIIVGNSETGKTNSFNVLYAPLKLINRNLLSILPGSKNTPMDIVPIDYVTQAICHIMFRLNIGIGEIFHLTAGQENAITTGEVTDLAVNFFNERKRDAPIIRVHFLPHILFRVLRFKAKGVHKVLFEFMGQFLPYICIKRIFDNRNTVMALRGTGIEAKPFRSYYRNILSYSLNVNWGKNYSLAA